MNEGDKSIKQNKDKMCDVHGSGWEYERTKMCISDVKAE